MIISLNTNYSILWVYHLANFICLVPSELKLIILLVKILENNKAFNIVF